MAEKKTALEKWMHLSMKASWLLLIVMLHVTYWTLFVPIAVLFKALSDPLRLSPKMKTAGGSFFAARKRYAETRDSASLPY